MSEFLRVENNGIEFFTNKATGESGMSQSGLAIACGISQQAMSKLDKSLITKSISEVLEGSEDKDCNPTTKSPSKSAKGFSSKGLNPTTKKSAAQKLEKVSTESFLLKTDAVKNGGAVKVYTAKFCAAVIRHYAFAGSETAQMFFEAIGEIGMTSYIQSRTGWLPEEFTAAPQAHEKLNELLGLATKFERAVSHAVDYEGFDVDVSESQMFWNEVLFSGFTVEEYISYQDQNLALNLYKTHDRNERMQEFFTRNPETAERLKPHTDKMKEMLTAAGSVESFYAAYRVEFGEDLERVHEELLDKVYAIALAKYKTVKT